MGFGHTNIMSTDHQHEDHQPGKAKNHAISQLRMFPIASAAPLTFFLAAVCT